MRYPVLADVYISPSGAPVEAGVLEMLRAELRAAGDVDGHAFHGNQWTDGSSAFGIFHDSTLVSEDVNKKILSIGDAIADKDDITKVNVTGDEQEYSVSVNNADKGRRLSFSVSKGNKKTEAYLNIVEFNETVSPRQARAALARTLDVLDMEDVDEVALEATLSDGGYLWARLGFQAQNPAGFREMAHERVQAIDKNYTTSKLMHDEYSREELNGLMTVINSNNARPDLPQMLADSPGGKSFLRGTSWKGVLNLRNAGATDRIDHFLGRKKAA